MLFEPPSSPADVHFRVFGFPVRIHPYFWIGTVLLGINGKSETPPAELLTWVAVVFVSILVHELGHAIVQRHFGGHPWITLHAFGGLASCDDCDRQPRSQILISLAGPAAGFLLALVMVAAFRATGHTIGFQSGDNFNFEGTGLTSAHALDLPFSILYWQELANVNADRLVSMLLQVNILWGLVNLLPVYPLDGGRVSREVCSLNNPRKGIVTSLQISIAAAALMAAYALISWGSFFTAFFFGYLAYQSYRALNAYRAAW
jgi:stage IV sporulation protein FB